MIKEGTVPNFNTKVFLTRICDQCGKEEKTRSSTLARGRVRRKSIVDLCKACSSLRINRPPVKTGADSPNWSGGIYIKDDRKLININGKYMYEHRYIMSNLIGRYLSSTEIVHHIDMNVKNNDVTNLYLCTNESKHRMCHHSMEHAAIQFLENTIWFNYETKQYQLEKTHSMKYDIFIEEPKNCYTTNIKRWFGIRSYRRYNFDGSKRFFHCDVAEKMIGRKLFHDELVHHIDLNGINNDPNNLSIMTKKEHSITHHSLQKCAGQMIANGKITFKDGIYG